MTPEQLAKLRNMRANGWPTRRIRRELGCTLEELRAAERAQRPPQPRPGPSWPLDEDERRLGYDLMRNGATWADVASALGTSRDAARLRVQRAAQRHGWPWPPVPHDHIRAAYHLRASGATWRDVAEAFGLGSARNAVARVRRAAVKHGWPWPVPRG